MPLPLVEAGHIAAALAGLLLLVLARGLARGYRAAFKPRCCCSARGPRGDPERARLGGSRRPGQAGHRRVVAVGALRRGRAAATGSRDRISCWRSRRCSLFLLFGTFAHRVSAATFERWTHIGYRLQAARFLRTAASMALAVSRRRRSTCCFGRRSRFSRPDRRQTSIATLRFTRPVRQRHRRR